MRNFILALDSGTTSNRAILFNRSGDVAGVMQQRYNLLLQMQANANARVIRPLITETTDLGVAYLAGLATGLIQIDFPIMTEFKSAFCKSARSCGGQFI